MMMTIAAVHESGSGTFRTSSGCSQNSVAIGRKADVARKIGFR